MINSASLIEVIEVVTMRGDGKNAICRRVIEYWSKEGVLLADNDPFPGATAKTAMREAMESAVTEELPF